MAATGGNCQPSHENRRVRSGSAIGPLGAPAAVKGAANFGRIKNVCKSHGCYGSHNMAACLKGDQKSFVFGGRGKRQTLKLRAPGPHGIAELMARIRTRGNGIASKRKGNERDAMPTAPHAMGSSPRSMATLVKSPANRE